MATHAWDAALREGPFVIHSTNTIVDKGQL